jgi:histidine triad (HIT) family protein
MYDKNNIFSKILRKEINCEIVYEDEKVLFINDINPKASIHMLGIPKIEAVDFNEFILKADKEMISHFFLKITELTKEKNISETGYRLITNNGENGGQEVPHFHIHILGGQKL